VRRFEVEVDMQIELEGLKRRLYVDNGVRNIKFFQGTNADVTSEDMAGEINKFFAAPMEEDDDSD
jgi:hypothetical protein